MAIYECCVTNFNEAVKAEAKGANRIELCENLALGGTTPSYGTIKNVVKKLNIPTMVMIRPRGGNFEFNSEEVIIMLEDIRVAKSIGAYGVVIGALNNKKIDLEVTKKLIEEAKPMNITFHMAFDEIENKFEALDLLIELGVNRILTKGCLINALEGKENIKKYIEYADNRIVIMPGCKVDYENKYDLMKYTGAIEVHGTKIV